MKTWPGIIKNRRISKQKKHKPTQANSAGVEKPGTVIALRVLKRESSGRLPFKAKTGISLVS